MPMKLAVDAMSETVSEHHRQAGVRTRGLPSLEKVSGADGEADPVSALAGMLLVHGKIHCDPSTLLHVHEVQLDR